MARSTVLAVVSVCLAACASSPPAPRADPPPAAPPTASSRVSSPPPAPASIDRPPPPPPPSVTVKLASLSGTGEVTPAGLLHRGSLLAMYAIEGGGIELLGATGTLTLDGKSFPVEVHVDPATPKPLGPGPIGVVHGLGPVEMGPVLGKAVCGHKVGVSRVAIEVRHTAGVTKAEGNFVVTCGGFI